MLTDVQNYFTLRIRRTFVIILSLKIPPHLKCVATLPCEMSSVCHSVSLIVPLLSGVADLTALSSSKADTFDVKLQDVCVTVTINTSFPVANFLKCVVTEFALFSIVAFKTLDISQGSVATHTHLRCGEIFSDGIITKFLLILTVK